MARELDFYNRQVGRHSRVPNIGISAPAGGFTPAGFEAMVYTPQKEDMSLLQRSLATLDERKENTDKQRATIMSAIGNLKLAPEEDKWKSDYADRIADEITKASQFGDYSTALEVATNLAGTAITSPEVTGRLRYNEERQKYIEELKTRNARGEIDSDTFERAMAQNPYAYSDTYDETGKIVGGTAWNPSFRPVKDINLTQVMAEIKSLVTPSGSSSSSSGGTSQVYLDANGNQTRDASKARGIFATVKGGGGGHSYTGVTAKQWADAYDAWMSQHPEAAAAFEQKRQNQIWAYNQQLLKSTDSKLSENDRTQAKAYADVLYKNLTDKDGGLLTAENYARSIANPMFKVMQFSKSSSSSEGGSFILDNESLNRKRIGEAAANAFGLNALDAELYSMGAPIESLGKNVANDRRNVDNAASRAGSLLIDNYSSSTYSYPIPIWNQK